MILIIKTNNDEKLNIENKFLIILYKEKFFIRLKKNFNIEE